MSGSRLLVDVFCKWFDKERVFRRDRDCEASDDSAAVTSSSLAGSRLRLLLMLLLLLPDLRPLLPAFRMLLLSSDEFRSPVPLPLRRLRPEDTAELVENMELLL